MKMASKGILKAKMLEYFKELEKTGEELIVTDNNLPVINIISLRSLQSPAEVFKENSKKVKYYEDILTSTTSEWVEK